MRPAEIALVVLSALLHAIWSASIKGSASPLGFNLLQLVPTLAAACVLPFFVSAAEIPTKVWAIVAGTGICHGFYFYWLARCLELGELSVVYPIARSAPAFLPLVAIPLLGESISLQGGLGIAVVVAGMIAIQVDGVAMGSLPLPNTGSWGTYAWSRAATLALTAGEHALRWENVTGGGLGLVFVQKLCRRAMFRVKLHTPGKVPDPVAASPRKQGQFVVTLPAEFPEMRFCDLSQKGKEQPRFLSFAIFRKSRGGVVELGEHGHRIVGF